MEITLKGTPEELKKAFQDISGIKERKENYKKVNIMNPNENYFRGRNFRGEKEIAEILQNLSRRITSY